MPKSLFFSSIFNRDLIGILHCWEMCQKHDSCYYYYSNNKKKFSFRLPSLIPTILYDKCNYFFFIIFEVHLRSRAQNNEKNKIGISFIIFNENCWSNYLFQHWIGSSLSLFPMLPINNKFIFSTIRIQIWSLFSMAENGQLIIFFWEVHWTPSNEIE